MAVCYPRSSTFARQLLAMDGLYWLSWVHEAKVHDYGHAALDCRSSGLGVGNEP